MKNIWLIRHGECHSNVGEKTIDPAGSTLTTRGLLQAQRLADCIKSAPQLIIHSPYPRTQQSALPLIKKFPDVSVEQWPVQEFIYLPHGSYLDSTQESRRPAVDDYWQRCDPLYRAADEAESFADFIARMQLFIDRLRDNSGHIVVFTHGHVIRTMMWKIITGTLKNDKSAMAQYRSLRQALYIPNAVILKISLDAQELQMSQLLSAHLPAELVS